MRITSTDRAEFQRLRNQMASVVRWRGADDPQVVELERAVRAEKISLAIREWGHDLTAEQIAELRLLLGLPRNQTNQT